MYIYTCFFGNKSILNVSEYLIQRPWFFERTEYHAAVLQENFGVIIWRMEQKPLL